MAFFIKDHKDSVKAMIKLLPTYQYPTALYNIYILVTFHGYSITNQPKLVVFQHLQQHDTIQLSFWDDPHMLAHAYQHCNESLPK